MCVYYAYIIWRACSNAHTHTYVWYALHSHMQPLAALPYTPSRPPHLAAARVRCRPVKCADMSIFRAINFRKGVAHTTPPIAFAHSRTRSRAAPIEHHPSFYRGTNSACAYIVQPAFEWTFFAQIKAIDAYIFSFFISLDIQRARAPKYSPWNRVEPCIC